MYDVDGISEFAVGLKELPLKRVQIPSGMKGSAIQSLFSFYFLRQHRFDKST
jgi:hypothetical protein